LGARIAEKRWWVLGGAVAAIAAVTAAVVLTTGQDGAVDTAAETTSAATSVAGVPGLTEATSAEQSPSSPAPSTPSGPPAPPPPPPPPSGPVIAADALAPLLLPAPEIARSMGQPDMTAMAVESKPLGGNVTPPHCTGAWGPAYATTYNGTGYTGLAVQGVGFDTPHRVAQAVVAFPDPTAAKGVYDKLIADWNACQSTRIVFEVQGATNNVDVGRTVPIGDIMTLKIVPTDSAIPGQQCERGMALRGNVIVDVRTCSPTVGSSGYSITRAIADRIR
jgi:serine/threonine-protein kinase